jgi:hypothetical protein
LHVSTLKLISSSLLWIARKQTEDCSFLSFGEKNLLSLHLSTQTLINASFVYSLYKLLFQRKSSLEKKKEREKKISVCSPIFVPQYITNEQTNERKKETVDPKLLRLERNSEKRGKKFFWNFKVKKNVNNSFNGKFVDWVFNKTNAS